ncbi:aspartyl-phosphate phosphatase Spo0E family protein [Bacillus sp. P2(2020)]|uniref:Aspartyl-phosphate phosphatase Spo0E family protein n=1 Tax=Calidifontibacillus erzurumensis TaxID=2741433 RepID=A0A8J8GH53_9BACI|nr:aspartyl-phosphate phosphatase Spo0E family protein [Calidifontibacillus erzurumensis]
MRQQIEIKRKQLFEYAANYGINSQLTIKCSQELDLLLNRLDQNLYHIQSA